MVLISFNSFSIYYCNKTKPIFNKCFKFITSYNLRYTKQKRRQASFILQHFCKDFIRLYGLAHDEHSYDDATISKWLYSWNCEFFQHCQIGISKFAEKILANVKYLEDNMEILDQNSLTAFVSKTKNIGPYLNILDTRHTNKPGMYIYIQRYTPFLYLVIFIYV